MKSITYQIKDKNGLHARPAGKLVRCAERFSSEITVERNGERADCKKLFSLMRLGIKPYETVTVSAEGEDEEEAVQSLHETMLREGL